MLAETLIIAPKNKVNIIEKKIKEKFLTFNIEQATGINELLQATQLLKTKGKTLTASFLVQLYSEADDLHYTHCRQYKNHNPTTQQNLAHQALNNFYTIISQLVTHKNKNSSTYDNHKSPERRTYAKLDSEPSDEERSPKRCIIA